MTASGRRLARLAGGGLLAAVAMLSAAALLTPAMARPALAATVTSDSGDGTSPTPAPTRSATPRPTVTPRPTATPRPSATPRPTWSWSPRPTVAPAGTTAARTAAPGGALMQIRTPFGATLTLVPAPGLVPASVGPTGSVDALSSAPTPMPTTGTSVTAVGGNGSPPGIGAQPVSSPGATVETAVALGGTAALLGMAVAWRTLRPRRRVAALAAAPAPAEAAAAVALPESALFRSWKRELDDLADLAALTVDPAELPAARQRRSAFSADAIARRLVRSIEQPGGYEGA